MLNQMIDVIVKNIDRKLEAVEPVTILTTLVKIINCLRLFHNSIHYRGHLLIDLHMIYYLII